MLCLKMVPIIVYPTMQNSKCKCFLKAILPNAHGLSYTISQDRSNSKLNFPTYIYWFDVCQYYYIIYLILDFVTVLLFVLEVE